MKQNALIAASAILAYGAWLFYQQQSAPADASQPNEDTPVNDAIEEIMNTTKNALGLWRPPAKYAGLIASAEAQYSLPTDLLARLLYQESRYREDIITGATRSPVGAMGIAQFMPATAKEFGIDPLNPAQAIPAAARYVAKLYARFGNWSEALAAYNWGQGNVSRKGLSKAPRETRLYYAQILSDINSTNGTAYA